VIDRRVYEFFAASDGRTVKGDLSAVERQADRFCSLVAGGEYAEASGAIRAENSLTALEKRQIIDSINKWYLCHRNVEWGNHGIRRTFRFWDDAEKRTYLKQAQTLVTVLREFTPFVTFGFGSVLGFIRDNGFIPHDDDMDLLVALPARGETFRSAKRRLREFLEPRGFNLHGDETNFPTHFGVNTASEKAKTAVDVFVGFIERDRVAWFPSSRSGMPVTDVFPTSSMTVHGETVSIPAHPERYLEATYGPDWREPITIWNHPWQLREFKEFI